MPCPLSWQTPYLDRMPLILTRFLKILGANIEFLYLDKFPYLDKSPLILTTFCDKIVLNFVFSWISRKIYSFPMIFIPPLNIKFITKFTLPRTSWLMTPFLPFLTERSSRHNVNLINQFDYVCKWIFIGIERCSVWLLWKILIRAQRLYHL